MKNIFFILAICASFNSHPQKHVAFGLKGGFNLANLKSAQLEYSSFLTRASFHAGGLAHIHLTQQFALQPEVLFSGQGAKYKTDNQADDLPDIANEWHLNYINIPVMLQYLFRNRLRLETGPQVGFLSNAKIKERYGEQDIKELLKKVDFSWGFGAGYLTKFRLGVDARYNHGLSEIDARNGISTKNRVFQVGLFYLFDKGGKK